MERETVYLFDEQNQLQGVPTASESLEWPDVDPSNIAFLLLSGGTTGIPKLIPRTHNEYELCIRLCSDEFDLNYSSAYLTVNPVSHTSTLGCPGILGVLFRGGKVVLTNTMRPRTCFDLVRTHDINVTCLVPSVVRQWVTYAKATRQRLPDEMIVEVGSAKFFPDQVREAKELLGGRLTQWFGMGEGLLTRTRFDDPDEVIVNMQGSLVCDIDEVHILKPDGTEAEPGEAGELVTRGPYTVRSYYNGDKVNKTSFTSDGFFRSGDLATMRPDNNLVVVGRIKDIVNRHGEKTPIDELEQLMLRHDAIYEAAVVSVVDFKGNEHISAYYSLVQDSALDPPEVKSYLQESGLATYKIPGHVVVVPAIPKTPVGKIDKECLRNWSNAH